MNERRKWTRNEEIIVLKLYCEIPFKESSKNNIYVIKIANLINRTPSSVNMKVGNFGSFDDNLKKQGIVGLTNVSRLDRDIWDEFYDNWDKLVYESNLILALYSQSDEIAQELPTGKDKIISTKQRVNQDFFRKSVLASYNNICCITGINNPELLIASHIKPWKASDDKEKTNPTNGLCLNSLHDKAFDRGFITIDEDYCIRISDKLSDIVNGKAINDYFKIYDKKRIILPDRFLPNKDYLKYHNDVIFESWI